MRSAMFRTILLVLLLSGCSVGSLGWDAEELVELGIYAARLGLSDGVSPGGSVPDTGERGPARQANERASQTPAGDRARGREHSGKRDG